MDEQKSVWKGSSRTAAVVAAQIQERWGPEEVKNYHPSQNCFTYNGWVERGYRVKRGERALKSVTFIKMSKKEGEGQGPDESKFKTRFTCARNVNLFYILQVEKQ